ncbi:MAG: PAS domain-containing protein [Verrucomicrobiales bacterium]|nr:PAS domain-containing protein [Verrucomicrobiales bacterium]
MNSSPDRAPPTVEVSGRGPTAQQGEATGRGADARSELGRVGIAVAVPLLTCAVQWSLWEFIQPYVWFLFSPAVYVCAYLGGLRGGLIATSISAFLVWYVFMPPQFSLQVQSPSSLFSVAVFIVMGALFGIASDRLAKARRQSAEALAVAEKRTREAEVANLRVQEEVAARVRAEKDAERKAAELIERQVHSREIERWSRLYAALSQINQVIVRVTSQTELVREVARATVEFGGFKLAWIGRHDDRTREVAPLACAGEPREFVYSFRHSSGEDDRHDCACGPAIRNDQACVINALTDAAEMGDWLSGMKSAGIQAAAVFPIRVRGVVWGVFGVYAEETGVFRDKETALLEQAAMDIGYAIENLENETLRRQAEDSLRTSEYRRALALDAAQAGTWQWELSTGRNLWSDELWPLYGLTPHACEPSYEAWRQTVRPDDRDAVERSLQEAVRREGEILLEWRVATSRDGERWLMSRGRPLRDSTGRLTHYIGVVIEITARKRSEQLLARNLDAMVRLQNLGMLFVQAEGLPAALGEVVDTAIAISGADFGNIQLLDPATGNLRIMAHRGLPQQWLDFWNSEGNGQGSCGAALAQGERVIVEDVVLSPMFRETPALGVQLQAGVRAVQSTPLVSRSAKVVGMFSTHFRLPQRPDRHVLQMLDLLARQAADLIEQAQAEGALRESEARLRFALETSQTGAWDLDLIDHTAHRSLGHDRVFGYSELLPSWTYERFLEHVLPEDRASVDAKFRTATATRSDWGFECRIRRADGVVRWIWAAGRHVLDANGEARRMAGIVQDITERKEAENALRESEHRFRQLNADLEQRVRERTVQLETVNRELEMFSYSVSHDLRAPLRHVQGFVGMLERELGTDLSERSRHLIKTISDSSHEMAVLIDDLLAFSRMGRQEFQETRVSLDHLVREARNSLHVTPSDRVIEWQIAPLPTVRGDPAMLRLALVNLLDNAVKYSRPRHPAKIEVGSAGMEQGRVVLFVRDNGVGFDLQYARKLFGVFQRLHNSSEFEGTGIGLANVHRIITRHGGRVWAESEPDQGATFYFTLVPAQTESSSHA